MNSKNQKRNILAKKILKEGKLPNNKKLSDVSASEFATSLNEFIKSNHTFEDVLQNALKHLKSTETVIEKLCKLDASEESFAEQEDKVKKDLNKAAVKISNIESLLSKKIKGIFKD